MATVEKGKSIWLLLLAFVLISNILLYNTNMGLSLLPDETQAIVIGSLLDLILIFPLLIMLYKRQLNVKLAIILGAAGCIIARFLIPKKFLEPFIAVTWAGIAIEAALIIFEIILIITFVRYIPKILKRVKGNELPTVFSFPQAIDLYVKKNPIIHMICSESLMFYYAFFSWKKKPREGITLYKSSNYIAFQIMMIHAIVIETLGFHWWLHDKSMILSIVLLVLNIYSVIFFLADIQAIRLNPVYINDQAMYISLGLLKRAEIRFDEIESIIEDREVLQEKKAKDTIDFIVSDFSKADPDLILVMKKPLKATLFMGLQKEFAKVAIRSDSAAELKQVILDGMARNNNQVVDKEKVNEQELIKLSS